MSEQERETELVAGVIEGVTQKRQDTWQVAVKPDGSQYTKNLWTKDSELVSALTAKLGQHGAFVCNASYWTNNSGQQVRSLWISEESGEAGVSAPSAPSPGAAAPAPRASSPDQMTKEEWARKDSAIHKMACIKTAADALKHTLPAEPTTKDLNTFVSRVTHLTLAWHRQLLAERDDPTGEDIPFA